MSLEDAIPLGIGDQVMDDTGQVGYVYRLGSAHINPDGEVTDWSVGIRYRWDMPDYGKERSVSRGGVTKLFCGMHPQELGLDFNYFENPDWETEHLKKLRSEIARNRN